MLSRSPDEPKRTIKYVLDVGSISAQLIGLFIWPLTITSTSNIWFIPLSLFFVSFRWWENYVTKCSQLCEPLICDSVDDLLTFILIFSSDSISRPHQGQPIPITIQDLCFHFDLQNPSLFYGLRNFIKSPIPRVLHKLLKRLRQSHDTDRRSETNLEW